MGRMKSSLLVLFPLLLLSCGGNANVGKVCGAAADRMFAICHPQDPTDQTIIWNALNPGLGIPISGSEIADYTKGRAKSDCESGLNDIEGLEITDEAADAFIAALDSATTCQEVMTTIVTWINQA